MKEQKGIELDTCRLLGRILHRAWLVALGAAVGGAVFLLGTAWLVTPRFQSSAMFYVNNSAVSGDSISAADLTAAKSLVDSYIVVLKTRESLQAVIEDSGVDRTCGELKRMLRAEAVNSTEFFEVTVTSPDAGEAERIASAIARVLPERISGIIEGTSVRIAEAAVLEAAPSAPSYGLNALIGVLLGAVLALAGIVTREFLDPLVRCEQDIVRSCGLPVWAAVPEETGDPIGFAAAESYQLLCEKLLFALEGEARGRVVGVTGALSGDGCTAAGNLARALAQTGMQVVLIDCGLRHPSDPPSPGLSDFLAGEASLEMLIRDGQIPNVSAIASGSPKPDPARLLHSGRLSTLLEQLRQTWDYVILDLPPVAEVSDTLAVARQTDGILLTVRQNYSSRAALTASVQRLESLGGRLLGAVYIVARKADSAYGQKYDHPFYQKYPHPYENPQAEQGHSNFPKA